MNKRLFCFIVASISIVAAYITVIGEQQKRRPTARKTAVAKPTPTPAPTPKRLSSIDEEAINGCAAEFRQNYTVCDSTWLSEIYKCRSDRYILEFRDVTTMIKKKSLSAANQMNGLEWDGAVILRSKVWRWHFQRDSSTYNHAVAWEDVNDAQGKGMDVCLATKYNGTWKFKLSDQGLDNMFGLAVCFTRKKVDCGVVKYK